MQKLVKPTRKHLSTPWSMQLPCTWPWYPQTTSWRIAGSNLYVLSIYSLVHTKNRS